MVPNPNFKLVFGAVCVEVHPGKNLSQEVRKQRVATQVKSKKTKASVLAKLQLEDEMVGEEDNPDKLMKGSP